MKKKISKKNMFLILKILFVGDTIDFVKLMTLKIKDFGIKKKIK